MLDVGIEQENHVGFVVAGVESGLRFRILAINEMSCSGPRKATEEATQGADGESCKNKDSGACPISKLVNTAETIANQGVPDAVHRYHTYLESNKNAPGF